MKGLKWNILYFSVSPWLLVLSLNTTKKSLAPPHQVLCTLMTHILNLLFQPKQPQVSQALLV